jgi:hypothetical protein
MLVYDKFRYLRNTTDDGNRPVITDKNFVTFFKTGSGKKYLREQIKTKNELQYKDKNLRVTVYNKARDTIQFDGLCWPLKLYTFSDITDKAWSYSLVIL